MRSGVLKPGAHDCVSSRLLIASVKQTPRYRVRCVALGFPRFLGGMLFEEGELCQRQEEGSIRSSALWEAYARYPYMPRLTSRDVLEQAVSNGVSELNWQQETFAYAEAHDGDSWVGVRTAQHVVPSASGLLIHPDFAPEPARPGPDEPADPSDVAPPGGRKTPGGGGEDQDPDGDDRPSPTQFYAQFHLDSVRGIQQLSDILEHIAAHLGSDVELELELRANNDDGYDDGTRRTVSENAQSLNARAAEFE